MISFTKNTISYTLSEADLNTAYDLAVTSSTKYSQKIEISKSSYHQNDLRSHLVGKIGEVASGNIFQEVSKLLKTDIDLDLVYLDPTRDSYCDLIINNMRIEIKTWRPDDWVKYGACIAERQAVKLHKKADVVVYGVYNKFTKVYSIVGFNTIEDIMQVKPELTGPENKQILNRVMLHRNITELPLSKPETSNA